jgi:hypothetical protein
MDRIYRIKSKAVIQGFNPKTGSRFYPAHPVYPY